LIRLFQSDKICVYFAIIENCCNSQFPHITMIFFGCQSNQCRRAFMNFKFCNCTWQCSKIRGTFLFRFSEYLTSGYISAGADFIQAVVTLTNSDTHAHCTSNFEFWADAKSRHRHDIFTNIRLSANLIAKVCCRPGIKIAMSFREASVTDEKIAIDFVASAHDAGCHEGYQQVTFSSNLTA